MSARFLQLPGPEDTPSSVMASSAAREGREMVVAGSVPTWFLYALP